ncbi:HAD family hydrolase [Mesoterricola silvestris]|uniref:phosphoglycolate phosphatase n=1 Tax=Mesoterricola silvestris TaxID=2927979 RepID=A0AA48K7E0_9BACT|nr:HAD family hydrolase [Mesoterricola silvestris]BDU71001.1 hydrolase [Mesoterricola silvestris]
MKLVIWDFDGTLADTRPIIEAGMDHALRLMGLPGTVREEWLKCVGLPLEEGITRTFGPMGRSVEEVLPIYRSYDYTANEHLIRGFEGMGAILEELHGRGVRQAIASSKRTLPLVRQVAALGWTRFFEAVVTPDDVARAKPDPESILLILDRLGVPPGDAVMVGDTPFDLDMATGAGVRSVAVGHGFYGEADLAASGPMAYASDAAALRDILLAWSEA